MDPVALASAVLAACTPDSGFVCAASSQCGTDGICEPTGGCSFADPGCPSGRRYGPHSAASLRDRCVGGAVDGGLVADAIPGAPDAPPLAPDAGLGPQVRVIADAWFSGYTTTTYASPMP